VHRAAPRVKIVHQLLSGDLAGGQLVALRLARAAAEAGHEALLVSPTDGPVLERAAAAGLESRVVPLGRSFRLDDAWRYSRLLRRERADLLHTHTHLAGNVLGRAAGRLAGVPVVAHMHIENAFRADRLGRAAQVVLDDVTARLCARILVVSEATRQELARQGYPRGRMEVVYNGVEPARAEPLRLVAGPTVLHVGRLAAVKGQRELIRALPLLDGVAAVLVGRDLERGGAYERELADEAERLGVRERVVFAGQRDDVPGLLAGCEVCALPSLVEGLPLVLLEAMTQARPVVATPVGGTPELVVDGETGVLVPPGDPEALARALAGLLSDPERARRLGEAGRRRVEERFTAAAMARRVLEVYGEVTRTMRP
jgi:glycosyltransferase involved in cell wall biosynthesis